MVIRWSKICLVAAASFYCLLTVYGNITDYSTSFKAVESTLLMQYVYPGSGIGYRAITSPALQHVIYCFIICLEITTALLCILGVLALFKARAEGASEFNKAKYWAVVGLTLGFLSWQVIFMSKGSRVYS